MRTPVPTIEDPLLAKVKRLILRRGGDNAIRAVSRAFHVMDDDGDLTLTPEEFSTGLREYGLTLSDAEVTKLVNLFDKNRDGKIGINEFLTGLRAGMPPKRRAFVQRAFALFDQNGDGKLSVEEFRARFQASQHPLVLQGERAEEEVLADFIASFDDQTNPDGVISKQEFEQYYAGVSAGIDSDDFFIELLRRTWDLRGGLGKGNTKLDMTTGTEVDRPNTQKFSGLDDSMRTIRPTQYNLKEKEQAVSRHLLADHASKCVQKVKKACIERVPGQFRGLGREFRKLDPKRTGFIEIDDLEDVVKKAKLHFSLTPEEVQCLSDEYDTDADGTFDYMSLMNAVCGEMQPQRKLLLEKTWRKLPRNPRGEVLLEQLVDMYVPDYTPEVARGQTSRGRALNKFLDVWDARHCPSGRVHYSEFEEYHAAISQEIPNSRHFDTLIKMSWKVWEEEAQVLLAALVPQ